MKKIELLLVTNRVPTYRIPLFESLSDFVNLTVVHSGRPNPEHKNYNEVTLNCVNLGPFYVQPQLLFFDFGKYDLVIYSCDLRWICSILMYVLQRRGHRRILWGGWVTKNGIANKLRVWLQNNSEANIFYCKKHIEEFASLGMRRSGNFVANNTVFVHSAADSSSESEGFQFLHVGTLNSRKRLDIAVSAISILVSEGIKCKLLIIGEGENRSNLERQVEELSLRESITFFGHIEKECELACFYRKCIASISPGQAGLSVLQSMAFGVPFITYSAAISGGEIYNIENNFNGILVEKLSVDSFATVLRKICKEELDLASMGANAYKHYKENASMEGMAKSFKDSIDYALDASKNE